MIRMEHDSNGNCCLALTRSCDNACCYVLGIEGYVRGRLKLKLRMLP